MPLDALFVNGRFRTGDQRRPIAHTMGVFDGVIVGLDDAVSGLRAERVIDLGGAPAVPGFHDAHHHLSGHGRALLQCDVTPRAVRSLDVLYATLAAYAATLPADAWVLASAYAEKDLGGAPRLEALDAVCGDRPLFMAHSSGHAGMVNSAAIHRIGRGHPRGLPDVDGGLVERRADGTPTGFLAEHAVNLATDAIGPLTSADLVRALARASEAAGAAGLTSVTEPGISGRLAGNGPADLAAYQTARDRGLLGVRVTVMPELAALHELAGGETAGEADLPGFGLDLGMRTGLGDDWLRLGGVKIFSDGALSTRTAALTHPYHDRPGTLGVMREDVARMTEQIVAAHLAGWQVATHAIGDAAVAAVLDAYAQADRAMHRPDARHRIEHCGLADDNTIERIGELGVIPVPQGRFIAEFGNAYLDAVGPERGRMLYRQRAFLRAGIELPGSSDCPVVDGAPLLGIHALVNRTLPDGSVLNPGECLTVEQALRAFTFGSAYADRQEHRKGTLARGKLADFVVLSDDLLEVPADRLDRVGVQATVVGGDLRFGALAEL
jgi:predicted amidohydrolase YtcJ